jgi:hypothetical protein
MSTESHIIVTCVRCKTDFEGFSEGQAGNCASDVHDDHITGHYGSAILDMETAYFADGIQHGLPSGQICDACIEHLIKAELLHCPGIEI